MTPARITRSKKLSLGFADQTLSSISNMLAFLAVARISTVDLFGSIALVFTAMTAVLLIVRGAVGTPILLLSGNSIRNIRRETQNGIGAALFIGCAGGAVIATSGALVGLMGAFLPLALALPLVLAQDVSRYGAMACGRPLLTLSCDGIWALGSAIILASTWAFVDWTTPTAVLFSWAGLAGVSWLAISVLNRTPPRARGFIDWWRQTQGGRLQYGAEAAIGSIASLLVLSLGVAFVGTQAAASLRGAGTFFGPLNILVSAIPIAMIPELVRAGYDPARRWRLLARLAAAMSVLSVFVGIVGMLTPKVIGEQLLGPSWAVVAPLLPFTGIEYASVAWVACVLGALRASGSSLPLLKARILLSCSLLSSSTIAAAIWGTAQAMAIGLAFGGILTAATLVRVAASNGEGRAANLGRRVDVRILP